MPETGLEIKDDSDLSLCPQEGRPLPLHGLPLLVPRHQERQRVKTCPATDFKRSKHACAIESGQFCLGTGGGVC